MPFRFLDALFGRDKLPQAKPDKLFALVTAIVTIQETLGWEPAGRAGLCLKPLLGGDFDRTRQEIEELMRLGAAETHSDVQVVSDELGYLWVIIADPQLDDEVNLIHLSTQTLLEQGYGPQLLAAVFRFRLQDTGGSARTFTANGVDTSRAYWIFNYKRGNFYPFVPLSEQAKSRNHEPELRAAALLTRELPVEQDQTRWFALWNCPV